MKQNFKWMFLFCALLGMFAFSACSDDDDETPTGAFPQLPEEVNDVKVGDSGKIEFIAYADWTISADQSWVKFKKTGTEEIPAVSVSGKAGEQSVTYVISDENLDFDTKTATVTLAMDGKTGTMKISRSPKERQLSVYRVEESDEGFVFTPTDSIKLSYNDNTESYHAKYAVRANYKWVLNVPEWIEILPTSLSGEPVEASVKDEDLTLYFLNVNMEKATKEAMEGYLKFRDYDGKEDAPVIDSISVVCPGTSDWNRIVSSIPETVSFTAEGKYANPDMGMELDALKITTLSAPDNGYKFYLLPKQNGWYGIQDPMKGNLNMDAIDLGWFGIDEAGSEDYPNVSVKSYELWASKASEEREATLLAVPEAVAKNIKDVNTDIVTADGDDILPEMKQYVVTEISQSSSSDADANLDFSMAEWLPDGVEGITIEPMPAEELAIYSGDFGVEKGYVVTYDSFDMYTSSSLKFGSIDSQCAPAFTDPDTALYNKEQKCGWLQVTADMGFQGFMFDFTNEFEPFKGPREATVVLMDPDTYQSYVVIRVVQNVDNGNSGK